MLELRERLYIGDLGDCVEGGDGWAVVHACRHPCYRMAAASLQTAEPRGSALVVGDDLYLDLIDPPQPLFELAPFAVFLDFAEQHRRRGERLLIHCNQGLSRAPSLALLFLAKRSGELPGSSFEAAREAFTARLPSYAPGAGILSFLTDRWHEL